MTSHCRFVVLTEDSGKDGQPTIVALARFLLRLVDPEYQSHRVAFVPRDPQEDQAMRGNVWKADGKNPKDRERRVRLLRYLARSLSTPDTYVLFHIDGDKVWSQREHSENVAKFEQLIRALPAIVDRGRARTGRATDQPLRLEALLLICPFRSIEAWLYQNLPVAQAICQREHAGDHVSALQAWESRRHELDELESPEKTVCLGKAFNLELTQRYPVEAAYAANASLAATVDRLRACTSLVDALRRTSA